MVGLLTDQGAIDGCAWSASSKAMGHGLVFLAEYDASKALMNIDGSDTAFKLVSVHGSLKKVGDVLEKTFRSGGVLVKARYKATRVCPKDSESCEVTNYAVTFDVSKGVQRQVVNATGDVGC